MLYLQKTILEGYLQGVQDSVTAICEIMIADGYDIDKDFDDLLGRTHRISSADVKRFVRDLMIYQKLEMVN